MRWSLSLKSGEGKLTVFLHVGTHKTGTTSLQRFAAKNRVALARRGLLYPSWSGTMNVREHYAHHDLAHAVAGRSTRIEREQIPTFLSRTAYAAEQSDILLSAEPIYRYCLSGTRGPRAGHTRYLKALGHYFRSLPTTVVIVFRRPDDYAESMYREHVMRTAFPGTFEEFRDQKAYLFDYAWQFRQFSEIFDSVLPLFYEDIKEPPGIVSNFMSALGHDVNDLEGTRHYNGSFDAYSVEVKRILNTKSETANNSRLVDHVSKVERRWTQSSCGQNEIRSSWESAEVREKFFNDMMTDLNVNIEDANPLKNYWQYETGAKVSYLESWKNEALNDALRVVENTKI